MTKAERKKFNEIMNKPIMFVKEKDRKLTDLDDIMRDFINPLIELFKPK